MMPEFGVCVCVCVSITGNNSIAFEFLLTGVTVSNDLNADLSH